MRKIVRRWAVIMAPDTPAGPTYSSPPITLSTPGKDPLCGDPYVTAALVVSLAPTSRYGSAYPQQKCCPGWGVGLQTHFWEEGRGSKCFPLLQRGRCHHALSNMCSGIKSLRGKVSPEYNFNTPKLRWISAFLCLMPLAFLAWLEAP